MATPGVKEVIWMWEQGGWWKPYSLHEIALLEAAFLEGKKEFEIFNGWYWSAIVNFKEMHQVSTLGRYRMVRRVAVLAP